MEPATSEISFPPSHDIPEHVCSAHSPRDIESACILRKDWLRRIATSPKKMVLMPIRGTNMQPTIIDGDVVMLDTGRTRIFDGQIYALGQGDTIMIKRLEKIVGGRVRIIAENRTEFPPYETDARDIRIIEQVIWFARELVPRE